MPRGLGCRWRAAAPTRERGREERLRQFREQVKSGSLKIRKASVAERAWKPSHEVLICGDRNWTDWAAIRRDVLTLPKGTT